MTKPEMIDKLNGAGLGTKTALKQLSVEELEKMVVELDSKEQEQPTEGTEGTEPESTTETAGEENSNEGDEPNNDGETPDNTEEGEVLSEVTHQLGIFTEFIYNVKHAGAKVVIENQGGGDVYTNGKGVATVGNKEQRITFGEKGELYSERISLMAASQPVVKITEMK